MARDFNGQWWKANKQEAHGTIFDLVKHLQTNTAALSQDYLKYAQLYSSSDILGLTPYSYSKSASPYGAGYRVTLNIVKSMIDTVTNKIAKNKPRITFLTNGGDYSMQQRAKMLTFFGDGIFYQVDQYKKSQVIFRDSCVFGTGYLKIYHDNKKICAERVLPDEVILDDVEAFYGEPRQMHQKKALSREVLLALLPSAKNKILNAPSVQVKTGNDMVADLVPIMESWHLRSGEDANDGRHVISVENATLIDHEWNYDYFPFVAQRWSERLMGNRGQGLAEDLMPIQLEINRILKTITMILRLVVPKLFVEKGSKVSLPHLNNDIGGIIEYSGVKPTYDFLQVIPPDLFNQLDRLYQRAYEVAGISQLSAQSRKPSGLDSGVALREFNDIETERFILKGQDYERFHMECMEQYIDRAIELNAKIKGGYTLAVPQRGKRMMINWNDIDLQKDQYIMQMFPTSFLPNTPAGKFQKVQEMMQAGMIEKQDGLKLLDFPDIQSVSSLYNAASDDIDAMLENMIEKGEYQTPEPYQNLTLGIQKCQSAYLRAKLDKVPEENLELLRRWMDEANAMLQPPQPQMPDGTAPMAVPEQAPVSDLLPVAP